MIPKAELQSKVKEQERQLQLIYKYNPSLRSIEENVPVLQSLGLGDDQIMEVVSKGHTTLTNTITNPTTGEEMAIFIEDISIQKDKNSGEYGVFIGKVPYREFFDGTRMTKEKLEELAKEFPEIRDIYEENQQLKSLLASLGKRYTRKGCRSSTPFFANHRPRPRNYINSLFLRHYQDQNGYQQLCPRSVILRLRFSV